MITLSNIGRRSALFPLIRAATASSRPAPGLIRYLSDEARSKIQTAVTSTPIVLFMKGTPQLPMCGFSRAAIQVLDLHGVTADKLRTYNVLEDEELRSGIKEFSDWPTIPQLYVNGEFVGGCDILLGMHQSGELATLFQTNKIVPETSSADTEPKPSLSS